MKRVKSTQIQGTNDSSIVSKLSSSSAGYFQDDYLSYFVGKLQKRTSLINRGYYIRFKAIESAFAAWFHVLKASQCKSCQVISFGAGYDTSYFRLKTADKFPCAFKYIEIDFLEVAQKKASCIHANNELSTILGEDTFDDKHKNSSETILHRRDYVLLAVDLNDIDHLQSVFQHIEVNHDLPTLFLSECSITYMDCERSDALISWAAKEFLNSVFITYEQVYPNDGFGQVMQSHFTNLGSALKSINTYPSIEDQEQRFLRLGWCQCYAIGMNDFYLSLDDSEKKRVQQIEMFDEFEVWHQKCSHYVLIWASHSLRPRYCTVQKRRPVLRNLSAGRICSIKKVATTSNLLQRYGHQCTLVNDEKFMVFGGFGLSHGKHRRIEGVICASLNNNVVTNIPVKDCECYLGGRMFHTVTSLSDGRIVVYGGRSAPSRIFNKLLILIPSILPNHEMSLFNSVTAKDVNKSINNSACGASENHADDSMLLSVLEKDIIPVPTYRHSASLVNLNGAEHILFFGGCSITEKAVNNCHILNISSWTWLKVPKTDTTPTPRHSHSAVSYNIHSVIVSGGLSEYEVLLNSVYIFDASKLQWQNMEISGLLPRYSHTSHIWENKLILIGGVSDVPGHELFAAVVHLDTLQAVEVAMPGQDPENPILLYNFASFLHEGQIWTVGGGGNCFSFGSHFNKHHLIIDVLELMNICNFNMSS